MSKEPRPYPRLYGLIGEALNDFPAQISEQLEAVLKECTHLIPLYRLPPALSLPKIAANADRPRGGEANVVQMNGEPYRSVAVVDRKLSGLEAVLEILHAAHVDHHDGSEEPLLGEHLVEGLLVVCRDLAESARDALRTR